MRVSETEVVVEERDGTRTALQPSLERPRYLSLILAAGGPLQDFKIWTLPWRAQGSELWWVVLP